MQYATAKNTKDILRAKVMIGGKYIVLRHQTAAFVNIKWIHEKYVKQPKKNSVYSSSILDILFHDLLKFARNIYATVSVILLGLQKTPGLRAWEGLNPQTLLITQTLSTSKYHPQN